MATADAIPEMFDTPPPSTINIRIQDIDDLCQSARQHRRVEVERRRPKRDLLGGQLLARQFPMGLRQSGAG